MPAAAQRNPTRPIATATAVIPAVLIGEAVGVCSSYSEEFFGIPFSTHLVIPASWLATIITGGALTLILNTRPTDDQKRWLWSAVVKGERAS